MINHIIECYKLAQKQYRIKLNWVGEVIYWGIEPEIEIWPFEHMVDGKLESALKNNMYKIRCDFKIQNESPS